MIPLILIAAISLGNYHAPKDRKIEDIKPTQEMTIDEVVVELDKDEESL